VNGATAFRPLIQRHQCTLPPLARQPTVAGDRQPPYHLGGDPSSPICSSQTSD